MTTTTRPTDTSRSPQARGLGAPRGGRARSAVGRRSSSSGSPASPVAPANALSRYKRKVSNHPLVACDDPAGWRRGARMNLRAIAAADPDTPERQRNCGIVPVGSQVEIRIKDGSAYYCGVETCGNVWLCPVCSPKIHHRRAEELRTALAVWESASHAASLVTITVPHDVDDPLSRLINAEWAAWKKVTAGAAWQRLKQRLGIRGYIMSLELTWGDDHGWHPHYHVLLVHNERLDAGAIAAVHGHIHSRLTAGCRNFGLREPDPLHGARIDANVSDPAVGAYLAKGGDWMPAEELTRSDLKTGRTGSRTPLQVLADYYATGDLSDRELWREYSRVTRGLAAVRWSRGLRAIMLGPAAEPERTDEELAAKEVHGDLIAVVPVPVWSIIRLAGLDHAVLIAAETGGQDAVNRLIGSASCGPPPRRELPRRRLASSSRLPQPTVPVGRGNVAHRHANRCQCDPSRGGSRVSRGRGRGGRGMQPTWQRPPRCRRDTDACRRASSVRCCSRS
jgi:Replication protein